MPEEIFAEKRKRGRQPASVSARRVRDLRCGDTNLTWREIAKRLGIGVTTAIKLWRSVPAAERRREVDRRPPRIPWWDRRSRQSDPVLNHNLVMRGSKICRLRLSPPQFDQRGREVFSQWCCGKTLDTTQFRKSALAVDGFYLRSLCKKCEKRRRGLAQRVSDIFLPPEKGHKPRGRPPKITKAQIDFLLATGLGEEQIAKKCNVSRSTVRRVRWASKEAKQQAVEQDWSKAESYRKNDR